MKNLIFVFLILGAISVSCASKKSCCATKEKTSCKKEMKDSTCHK